MEQPPIEIQDSGEYDPHLYDDLIKQSLYGQPEE